MFGRWFAMFVSLLLLVALSGGCKNSSSPSVVAITLSPDAVTLVPGEVQEFVATVTGAVDTGVTWSVTGGTILGSGNTVTYTAPAVAGEFVLTATSSADVSKVATASITVVAEPDPLWARQLGTSSWDAINGVAVDGSDHVLIAGWTGGILFGPNQGSGDAFVAKLAPDGSTVWAHQFGTGEHDEIMAVAVDASNHVFIAGYTTGSLFAPHKGYSDAFVAKLAPDGSFVWGYQHGTSAYDEITAVAVDASNHVLIAGFTGASLFAPNQGNFDAFVAKLASDGSPVWGYQHGTSALDEITAVAVDASDHVLIAGRTTGSLFAPNQGNFDAFVAKLAPDGSPVWGYQHGTSVYDEINAVAVDGGNHVLIAGHTAAGLFGTHQGDYDAFVAKLGPDGSPVWGYQHGTSRYDEINAVAVDGGNHVLIAGLTAGSLFGPNQGSLDAFVAEVAPDGSPVWGYQHGTSAWDEVISVAVDAGNHVLIAGQTEGSLFAPHQGDSDVFVAKLAP